jgi:hypothetical protein
LSISIKTLFATLSDQIFVFAQLYFQGFFLDFIGGSLSVVGLNFCGAIIVCDVEDRPLIAKHFSVQGRYAQVSFSGGWKAPCVKFCYALVRV